MNVAFHATKPRSDFSYTVIVSKKQSQFFYMGGIIMKKNLTEIIFILDRSGSMSGLEADTIGGFNSMIRSRKADGEALVSPVLFDQYERG